MSKITVSVVCTNYNKGDWIAEAIESFLRQKTSFEYEILVIDDGSTDHSPEIIREYAKKHPDKIRTFFNKKNIGITKTWIKVCKEARGKYIARCDGDDYWTDDEKLQKQLELLRKDKKSLWCSTDYDIITPEGKLTHSSAFESGLVDRSSSYAQMLATKGFTMASTWLVEANLMREINENLDSSAVDDTFNIQLDLFNKTKLTYLPEATVVFRLNEGSDSRPIEIEKIRSRNKRLLETQLEYIEKYKNVDYGEILRILLRRDMQNEMWAIERLQIVREQQNHIKHLETKIIELESTIKNIVKSRSYRMGSMCQKVVRLPVNFLIRRIRELQQVYEDTQYRKWLKRSQAKNHQSLSERDSYRPLISIIVPTYNTPESFFKEMIESVLIQSYDKWELVVVDDCSQDARVRSLIKEYAKKDNRVKYRFLAKNHHIAGATNEGIKLATGDFISLLDHDDILWPNALREVAQVLNKNKNLDFIYTDEDKVDGKGKHTQPFLKPAWNPDFMHSVNYITHFTTMRKSVLDKFGYENSDYNGAQDWELFLRVLRNIPQENIYHIPKILYSWRVHAASTAQDLEAKPYVIESQRRAIMDDLEARGHTPALIKRDTVYPGQWRVEFDVPEKTHTTSFSLDQPITYRALIESEGEYILLYSKIAKHISEEARLSLVANAARPDIGIVLSKCTTPIVMRNLTSILSAGAVKFIASLSRRNVTKHLYTTTRYNINDIQAFDGVAMVEKEKIKAVVPANNLNEEITSSVLSRILIESGYRNLYDPYIKC